MKNKKNYPFSVRKHAHDIEFRRARAWNELHDGGYTNDRLRALVEKLDELRSLFSGSPAVVWLTGTQYRLAQESVAWAAANRK